MTWFKNFLIVFVIIYALFNLYQAFVYSKFLFLLNDVEIFFLFGEVLKLSGEFSCSLFLILGSLNLKPVLLVYCLVIFGIKTFFWIWNMKSLYERTIGCQDKVAEELFYESTDEYCEESSQFYSGMFSLGMNKKSRNLLKI